MTLIRTRPEPTFQYFYMGFVILVLGGVVCYSSVIPGALMILIGLFFLLSVKGVHIDPIKKQIKPYFNFIFLKFGNWTTLEAYTHVALTPNNSSQTINHRGGSTTFRTKSYSVCLLENNISTLELAEFVEYDRAENFLHLLAEKLDLPMVNKLELIKEIALKNRPFRRR